MKYFNINVIPNKILTENIFGSPGVWTQGPMLVTGALLLHQPLTGYFFERQSMNQALVAHTCDPSYSGGWDQEDLV
jgi:hypothetical protein